MGENVSNIRYLSIYNKREELPNVTRIRNFASQANTTTLHHLIYRYTVLKKYNIDTSKFIKIIDYNL